MQVIPFPGKDDRQNGSTGPSRLVLPIAVKANARIRFATIADKSKSAISPEDAAVLVDRVLSRGGVIREADIAGPGDPLATPEVTIECLARLHRNHPRLSLGLVTNGLGCALLVPLLASSGLQRLTLCVDAITTVTVTKIYAWIRPGTRTMPLAQAAAVLVNDQAAAVAACVKAQIAVRIATTVYPGYNDDEVEEIALKMAALGAEEMTLLPYLPMPDDMGCLAKPGAELMARAAVAAARHLPVVADPAGSNKGAESGCCGKAILMPEFSLPEPSVKRPNVAVTSDSGMAIDQHLGQAARLLVYGPREDGLVCLLEARPAPQAGKGDGRWQALAGVVMDCFVLLTAAAGDNPRNVLRRCGLPVLITEGDIEGTVDALYGGGKNNNKNRK
ncbi:MAG: NifB/NifX family molybdenum-iron cluster-binding protein [Desulfobulbaceae bacterium]